MMKAPIQQSACGEQEAQLRRGQDVGHRLERLEQSAMMCRYWFH
jgi:hypothetical protein